MSHDRWLQQHQTQWHPLQAKLRDGKLNPRDRQSYLQWGLLYHQLLLDLARVQAMPHAQYWVAPLNQLATHIFLQLQDSQRAETPFYKRFWRFLSHTFPHAVQQRLLFIGLSTLVFFLGVVIAMATVAFDPSTGHYFLSENIIDILGQGQLWTDTADGTFSKASFLMVNNTQVAFKAYVSGLFFGIGTLLLLFYNGLFAMGGPLQVCFQYDLGWRLLLFMAPHGPVELSTIFLSGGAGMHVGWSLLFPGTQKRWAAAKQATLESLPIVLGCGLLLIVAGLIEGLISLRNDVPNFIRLAIGLTTGVALWTYLLHKPTLRADRVLGMG